MNTASSAETRPLNQVALPWYEAADYPEIRRLMIDDMPECHDDWLRQQCAVEAQAIRQGNRVCRVPINSTEFAEWCEGFTLPNGTARIIYVAVRKKEMEKELGTAQLAAQTDLPTPMASNDLDVGA
jgi:hypothetical protein